MRTDPNLQMVERMADALGALRERLVFLGGCTTGLLLTDPGAPPVRATRDVDVIVEVHARTEYLGIESELRELGFQNDRTEGAPICRWTKDGMLLDLMPTDAAILGFTNRWYPQAVRDALRWQLPSGRSILLTPPPHFLATKFEAFLGRGKGDYLLSRDLEDIVAVVDGRSELILEVAAVESAMREYLVMAFQELLDAPAFVESLSGHLPPDPSSQARTGLVLSRMRELASPSSTRGPGERHPL